MARNKYAEKCYCCGAWVDVGCGYPEWSKGKPRVRCMRCIHKRSTGKENLNKNLGIRID